MRCAFVVLLLVSHPALGQEPTRFVVRTADGALPAAAILAFGDDGVLHLEGGRKIAPADFIELRQEGRKRPAPASPPFVALTSGDCFPLDPAGEIKLVDGRLQVELGGSIRLAKGGPASLFLPYVAQVFRKVPDPVEDPVQFFGTLAQGTLKNDAVFLRGGDKLEGRLTSLEPVKGAVVVDDARTLSATTEQFAGVAFSTQRQAKVRARKPSLLAVTADGARVHLAKLHLDAAKKTWVGSTLFGLALELPLASVVSLQSLGGRAVFLSELAPARQELTPYLGAAWPMRNNASASGGPLRLASDWHDRGVGMHAESRVVYQLDGKFAWFEATVGLDDLASPRSRARAAVIVDGKRHDLTGARELRAAAAPVEVRLETRGARELVLVVEFGSFGDVRANVDWGSARLLKQP